MFRWIVIWAMIAGPAAAERAQFDISIRGIKVGELQLASEETQTRYSVAGRLSNTGLTQVIRRFSYTGNSQGRIVNSTLQPDRYVEKADTGQRISEVELAYRSGVPRVVRYTSPREPGPDTPDPSSQGGTVDPLTAIYSVLRDVPANRACSVSLILFDGRRQSRVSLRRSGTSGGMPVCSGRYERLKGFTAEEVARHRTFEFTLSYRDAGNGRLAVREVVAQSIYGQAVIQRQ